MGKYFNNTRSQFPNKFSQIRTAKINRVYCERESNSEFVLNGMSVIVLHAYISSSKFIYRLLHALILQLNKYTAGS